MMSANVIQLRQMLSEKFPGLRWQVDEQPPVRNFYPTGWAPVDEALGGGLPRGALAEIAGVGPGSATLVRELLCQAAAQNQIAALIDGNDSLDVTAMAETTLARLLWVRCHAAEEALRAADLILRDNNLPLVLLDLKLNAERELRKISPTIWYRFQRLVEETTAICLVITPRPMIAPAQTRLVVHSDFSLDTLESDTGELLRRLKLEISDGRQSVGTPQPASA